MPDLVLVGLRLPSRRHISPQLAPDFAPSAREAAGMPEQVLYTHWCVFLNLPSGLGSSDERTVWATSDNQLSVEATEELSAARRAHSLMQAKGQSLLTCTLSG